MRICQLIESTSGGSVRVALDLTQGLLAFGDEVVFVYSPLRADQGFYKESGKMWGAQFVSQTIHSSLCLSDILSLIRFVWFLRKTGPYDVLHAHSSKAGGIARLAAMLFPRMSVVYSPHAFVTMAPDSPVLFKYVEKILSWRSDAIIAVSQKEKEHAIQHLGINAKKLLVVPNSVRVIARSDDTLRLTHGSIVLGFVGRLVKQKNVERLVRAFHLSLKRNEYIRLLIIGDGPERSKLEDLLKELGLGAFVQCVGAKEAGAHYSSMDALVCSSDYEGFPLVFLEALSYGVPIISTPVGGVDEAIVGGQTGYVSANQTPEALSEVMNEFVALTSEEKEEISKKCKAHAASFSNNRMIRAVRRIYQDSVYSKKGTK